MHCPLCGSGLRSIVYEGVEILTCDECGGELLGPAALRCIVSVREQRFPKAMLDGIQDAIPRFGLTGLDGSNRSLTCPRCNGRMQLSNYGGDTGISIDRCEQCATMFLDHEELERTQAVLEAWDDRSPEQLRAIAQDLERTRRETAEATSRAFAGSRFAFVNAVLNRLVDAA